MGYHIISAEPLIQLTGLDGPVVRILTAIFIGYPLAIIYCFTLYKKDPVIQHVCFIVGGLLIALFLYGLEAFHFLVAIMAQYLFIQVLGANYAMVIVSVVFQMTYLIVGYAIYSTESYDIDWTTGQCILALRLLSVAWDTHDGAKDVEKLSNDAKEIALKAPPELLEIMGHSYFFGSFIVGPLFPLSRYRAFVKGTLIPVELDKANVKIQKGLLRLSAGIVYLTFHALVERSFNDNMLVSKQFETFSIVRKLAYITVWGKAMLCKYLAVWLIAEGSCIMTGLTYNGTNEKGEARWDGLKNVKVTIHETSITLQGVIDSFNVNTNLWMSRYVFKRLRFLGNRTLSHIITLLFLAVWHGVHVGYLICFISEYFYVVGERQFLSVMAPFEEKINPKGWLFKLRWITMYFLKMFIMSYCLLPFSLLTWSKISQVYKTTYIIPHLLVLAWFLFYLLVYPSLRLKKKKKE